MKNKNVVALICCLFILLFMYAAASKLMEFDKFKIQIGQSPLLTDYAAILVWLVPVVEIVIVGLLAFERTKLAGLWASFVLMVGFSVYIYLIMNFADHIPCSCGGILEKMSWGQHLVFNLVFVGVAVMALVMYRKAKQPEI
uniref:MauE/DoxX family redox-associated membrane protein n=1 Tax=Pedobacter schmidteae TaxID=2201271 RepID=UPI000EB02382|nr:MauE/DoxX family redox-associated membrane protein [Pedobacter schmidteae]